MLTAGCIEWYAVMRIRVRANLIAASLAISVVKTRARPIPICGGIDVGPGTAVWFVGVTLPGVVVGGRVGVVVVLGGGGTDAEAESEAAVTATASEAAPKNSRGKLLSLPHRVSHDCLD